MYIRKLLYFKLIYVILNFFFLYIKKCEENYISSITMETLFLKILLHNIENSIVENVVYNKETHSCQHHNITFS